MSMNVLYHHGILGQKWGVRRFQNEDMTWTEAGKERYGSGGTVTKQDRKAAVKVQKDLNKATGQGLRGDALIQAHTIPKGTTIYRTTTSADENTDGLKYISYLESDRNHYKGGWVRQTQGKKEAYEHTFTLTEDIKVPSRDELKSVINDVVGKNKALQKKTVDAWFDVAMPEGSWQRLNASIDHNTGEFSDKAWKKFTDDALKAYKNMSVDQAYFYTAQTLGKNKEVRNQVVKELQKRGYNAMTDEASVGGQNGWGKEGSDPLILFDSSILQKTGSKKISSREEKKSQKDYTRWYGKANRNTGAWSAI